MGAYLNWGFEGILKGKHKKRPKDKYTGVTIT